MRQGSKHQACGCGCHGLRGCLSGTLEVQWTGRCDDEALDWQASMRGLGYVGLNPEP